MLDKEIIWRPDGKPFSVHLSASALAELSAELPPAQADGSRATETGGLLFGFARKTGDDWFVAVEQLVPMEIEHARGQSWSLSGTDKAQLGRQLQRFAAHRKGNELSVVGWYRTHTRPGLFLDQSDFLLMRDHFAHEASIALIASDRELKGGIFFWEDGDIQRSSPYGTFDIPAVRVPLPVQTEAAVPRRMPNWAYAIPVVAGILLGSFWNPAPLHRSSQAVAELPRVPEGQPSDERAVYTAPPLPAPSTAEPYRPPPEADDSASRARTAEPAPQPHPQAERDLKQPARSVPEPQIPETPPIVPASARADAHLHTPVRAPEPVTEVEPAKPSGVRKVVGAVPGLGFLKRKTDVKDGYIPPRVTKQVDPRIPRPPQENLTVRFKLTINSEGQIQRAEL